jgi:hypothetical protein
MIKAVSRAQASQHCTSNSIEDELHFTLECPLYQKQRKTILDNLYIKFPNLYNLDHPNLFIWMMSNDDPVCIFHIRYKIFIFLITGPKMGILINNMKIIHTSTFTIIHTNFNHYLETTQRKQR